MFKPVAPWAASTGFRGNDLRHRALSDGHESRLAEDFLVNSRLRRHDREAELSIADYFTDASLAMVSLVGQDDGNGASEVRLPASAPMRMELSETLSWRRSVRLYTGDSMRSEHLAAVMRSTAGVTATAAVDFSDGGRSTLSFRTAPSGGGLYPISLHIAVLNVAGVDRGLYRYDPLRDTLVNAGGGESVEQVIESIDVPEEGISVDRANVISLLVGKPWRSMRKYGARGLRYLFLEAGAMTQNLHLAAVALGYGTVDCGCIYDDEAHEAMHLDGIHNALIHAVIVGSAS